MRARRVAEQGRRLGREAPAGRARRAVPSDLRQSPGFGVEVDAMPGGFVCSGSLKALLDGATSSEPCAGSGRSASCSRRSSARSSRRTRPEGLELDDLVVLGPDLRPEAEVHARGVRPRSSSRSCGCTPTGRASSSSRPSARRRRRSRWPREARAFLATSGRRPRAASSRPRRATALEFFARTGEGVGAA